MKPIYKIIRLEWESEAKMSQELNSNLSGGWEVVTSTDTGDQLVVIAKYVG